MNQISFFGTETVNVRRGLAGGRVAGSMICATGTD
jgi:hypothetical protein